MKATQISGACAATFLTVLMTACGSQDMNSAGKSPSPDQTVRGHREEPITPGGVAFIVLDHLGPDTVRQVVTFAEDEEGEAVGVMVRLRERTPHNFAVNVYPPEQAKGFGPAGKCPPNPRKGEASRCRVLDDGTAVTTSQIAEGFSDDNADGSVLTGTAVTPDAGAALAMYESYDDSPAISMADLEDLLSDPRLAWLTDPEVNESGKTVDLKVITG
jgi:hypothetical protein